MLESCGNLKTEFFKTMAITGSINSEKEISTPFCKSSIKYSHEEMRRL